MLIARSALIVFFIKIGYGILALSLITVIVSSIGQGVTLWYVYQLNPNLKISIKNYNV